MKWLIVLAHLFGGAFLINSVPHIVQGVSGNTFPSPFASPPGVGLSSPTVNVLWGFSNLVIGLLLLMRLGRNLERIGRSRVLAGGVGALAMALLLASWFGR
jgi:hypothetical protein